MLPLRNDWISGGSSQADSHGGSITVEAGSGGMITRPSNEYAQLPASFTPKDYPPTVSRLHAWVSG